MSAPIVVDDIPRWGRDANVLDSKRLVRTLKGELLCISRFICVSFTACIAWCSASRVRDYLTEAVIHLSRCMTVI